MFSKVAIANRGAVAARLVRALSATKIKSVVLCSEADRELPYVREADEYRVIGPPPPKDSYLCGEKVIEAALAAGAEAIHPGWGFLSEDADFAQKTGDRGLVFIGPSPKWLKIMGDKVKSRQMMADLGLPTAPATEELIGTTQEKVAEAKKLGFPLLIKPSGGGGGIGMMPAENEEGLIKAIEAAESQALRGFGRGAVYAERLVKNPRHVEFQVICDSQGGSVHLFERDCSIQRRRQKVIEEAGAPNIERQRLLDMASLAAKVLGRSGYDHLATLETLFSPETGFSFLEVNPRLQVEHGVTEEATGKDLVATQLAVAAGFRVGNLGLEVAGEPARHALEARIYAEDSLRFLPSPGPLKVFRPPQGESLRVETGFAEGCLVTPWYDPMIAQVIASGPTRAEAIAKLREALAAFEIEGLKTNLGFLRLMLSYEPFINGLVHTGLAEELMKSPSYKSDLAALGYA
ncbi:MAG: biotin carboxylase [Deltaproteobacteria bacterium]|jgi:acetyl-CoA carboxylase biotin carboxylase subunit|nr:biotin carboxylase [Deltaproteobacteria bacterium]